VKSRYWLVILSMILSVIGYKFLFNSWLIGVGILILIVVHESGHMAALAWKGYKFSLPIFIPFVGAFIKGSFPKDSTDEAVIGYGGPLFGAVSAIAMTLIWSLMSPESSYLSACFHLGLIACSLNLFNMLPMRPLDGGRIAQVLGRWPGFLGLLLLSLAFLILGNPILLIVIYFGYKELDSSPAFDLIHSLALIPLYFFATLVAPFALNKFIVMCLALISLTNLMNLTSHRNRVIKILFRSYVRPVVSRESKIH
jgi:Zn-dependent protease